MRIEVGGNVLECDVEATVAAFKAYTPSPCDCNGCRNYAAAQSVLAGDAQVFTQFGIDIAKAAEVYETGLREDSLLLYGGWFHFLGDVISDGDIFEVSEHLEVYFVTHPALVPEAFKGQRIVQMEFEWKIPWLLAEPWSP